MQLIWEKGAKMAEYINRKAAFDAITDLAGKAPTRSAYEAVWKSARALKKMPAADVVPVVRCKECAHLFYTMCAACGFLPRKPNDFCSYGERKNGGANNG